MIYHVDSAQNRYLAGLILVVLGVALLVGGHLYRGSVDGPAVESLVTPLLDSLSLLFVLLPAALIAMGLFMVVGAYRLAAKTAGGPVGRRDLRADDK